VNSTVQVEPRVMDVNADNIEDLISGVDVVLDGADNFELRYLLNEACVKRGLPWVYAGVLGTYGMTAVIIPGQTACLRCMFGPLPAPGTVPTCETAGVLGPAVAMVAALETTEGLKILLDQPEALLRRLVMVDVWHGDLALAELRGPEADCPVCAEGRYELLQAEQGSAATVLCGRNAVQVRPRPLRALDLALLARRLSDVGLVSVNEYVLRLDVEGYQMTVFPDGRATIKGTDDPAQARKLYARYIGS
jgi:hypothetical protein